MPLFLKHGGHGQSGLPWSEATRTLRQSVHVCACVRAHACAMSGVCVCVRVWVHVCTRMHPRVHDLHLCARAVACGACACVLCAHASLSPKPNFTKEKAALIIIPPPPPPPSTKLHGRLCAVGQLLSRKARISQTEPELQSPSRSTR